MTADHEATTATDSQERPLSVIKGVGTSAMPEVQNNADDWKTEALLAADLALNEDEKNGFFEYLTGEDEAVIQPFRDRVTRELEERDRLMPSSLRSSLLGLARPEWLFLSKVGGYLPGRRVDPKSLSELESDTSLNAAFSIIHMSFSEGAVSAFRKLFADLRAPKPVARPEVVERQIPLAATEAPATAERANGALIVPIDAAKTESELEIVPATNEPPAEPATEEVLADVVELKPARLQVYPVTQEEIDQGVCLDSHALAARSTLPLEKVEDIMQRVRRTPEFYGTATPKNKRSVYVDKRTDHYFGKALGLYWVAIEQAIEARKPKDIPEAE